MKNLLSVSLLILLMSVSMAQQHVQWRGEHRDGIYPGEGLLESWPEGGPELVWYYEGIGDGHSSATVTEDAIYTSGMLDGMGHVFAFDHKGSLLWKTAYGKEWDESWNGVRTTPMLYDGKLFIMSSFGRLVRLDASNGSTDWTIDLHERYDGRNIKWGVTENLLLEDGKLFVTLGGEQNNVIALDPDTGEMIWSCPGNGEISAYHSPAVFDHGGRAILVTQTQNSILGIDAATGGLLWSFEHINQWSVQPNTALYRDGLVYVVSGYGKGGVQLRLSADGSSITEVWRDENIDNQMGGVVLLGDRLYGSGQKNKKLFCLDWNTGEVLYSTSDVQRSTTIAAGGLLYCYDDRGTVALVKPGDGSFEVVGSFEVTRGENQHWAHLVIHDARLYVRHGNALMVYDIGK